MHFLQTLPSREAFYEKAAERMADALREGLAARGAACAALSGGSTPEPIYTRLAQHDLDWPRVTFAFVDERFVPPESEASNEGLARRALAPALSRGAAIAPMFSQGTLDQAADRADALYAALHIDIALMGMGGDGHTASWFPGSPELGEALDPNNPRSVIGIRAPQAAGSSERLTLTLSALARVDHVLLAITGADKFGVFTEARAGGVQRAPAAALFNLGDAFETIWTP